MKANAGYYRLPSLPQHIKGADSILFQDAMQDYINGINHERRLARKTTVNGYANYLHHLHGWLQENACPEPTLDDFNVATLRRFLYYLPNRNLRPRTIRAYFHPIIGIGTFLVEKKVLTENPAKALTMPRQEQHNVCSLPMKKSRNCWRRVSDSAIRKTWRLLVR